MAKILIIDDDPDALAITTANLRKLGSHDVVACRESIHAMDMIEKERPQVILLDIMMPRLDGFSICRQVKESDHLKSTKIIVYSAKIFDVDRRKAFKLGADAYLSKVIESDKLLETIESILQSTKEPAA
jgi:CheY-like chemotaxis protein